jgi:formamidopyrimidine-DNA glycosylase
LYRIPGGYRMSAQPMEQEAAYCARVEIERWKQTLAAQESRVAEEERQRVFAVAQQHCPTCGAPLVTVAYHTRVIDPCAHCQGGWLDCGKLAQVLAEEA